MTRENAFVSGDETIERCAENGHRSATAVKDRIPLVSDIEIFFPVFAGRVRDAMKRLEAGESRQEIRERHGSVVLQAAEEQVAGDGGTK